MNLESIEAIGGPAGGLLHDLGVVLVCAAVATLVFHRLRMPVIFGYLLSGMFLSPQLFDFSPIRDLGTIRELSELGVIFLLFYIGMEFDLRRLKSTIGPALLAVALQTFCMVNLGLLFAPILGWPAMSGFYLGAVLAISSTMVTVQVLREQGQLKHPHGQLCISILLIEDILAVMMLVLLTGVAVTGHLDWNQVWQVTFFVGVFVVSVFFLGKLAAPRLLDLLQRIGRREVVAIVSCGLVLGISVLAQKLHFSVALGAFLAGAILSQVRLAETIESATRPLRDIFSAVFFVSMGMLIDPRLLFQEWGWILALAALVVMGKVLTCWAGMFLFGQRPRRAFLASMSKCQIGEFSFIIAELGHSLGVTDERLFSFAFGVAALTILATPPLSARSEAIYDFMARRIPGPVMLFGQFYRNLLDTVWNVLGKNAVLQLVKRPFWQILIYFFLVNGIVLVAYYTAALVESSSGLSPYSTALQSGMWILAALGVAPFLIAMIRNMNVVVMMVTDSALRGTATRQFIQGRVSNIFNMLILLLVLLVVGGIYLSAAARYFPRGIALIGFLGLIGLVGLFFWRHMIRLNSRMESLFMESFTRRSENLGDQRHESLLREITRKYPWAVNISEVLIKEGTSACGRRVLDINLRGQTGCTVIAVGRGQYYYFDLIAEVPIFPGDRLVLLGTEAQAIRARRLLEVPAVVSEVSKEPDFSLKKIYLPAGSQLDGNTLAGADIRRQFGINVVGIQRGAEQITSPRAEEILKSGDVLIIVGSSEALKRFEEHSGCGQ